MTRSSAETKRKKMKRIKGKTKIKHTTHEPKKKTIYTPKSLTANAGDTERTGDVYIQSGFNLTHNLKIISRTKRKVSVNVMQCGSTSME